MPRPQRGDWMEPRILKAALDMKQLVQASSAVAVVLSLLFVGIELRQANDIATREVRSQLIAQVSEIEKLAIENPHHAGMLSRLAKENETLTGIEYEQARSFAQQLISLWAGVGAAQDSGFLAEGVFDRYVAHMVSTFRRYPALAPIVKERLADWEIRPEFAEIYEHVYEQIESAERSAR